MGKVSLNFTAFHVSQALKSYSAVVSLKLLGIIGVLCLLAKPLSCPICFQPVEKVETGEYLQSGFVQTSEENDAGFQIKAVQNATGFA